MKLKTKLHTLTVCLTIGFACTYSQANTDYVQGTVLSDKVFYQIGGGSAVMPPPSRRRPNELALGFGWKSNLTCGNFDIKTTVKNQLNGITEGFKDLYSNVIQSATGAVASLPAMIIQRANPQLYDLLSNGMYQAKLDFDSLKTSCEEMSEKLADYVMDSKWAKAAGLENYKDITANEPDAKKAKKQLEKEQGEKGITWIGGEKHGGKGQKPIEILKDVISAGFNMSVGRKATEKSAITQCDGRLCTEWTSPEDAAEYGRKILGDRTLTTCDDCGAPTKSQPGTGLAPEIESRTIEKMKKLEETLNANTITAEQLNSLSTSTIAVTRGLIESLRESPDATILGARLAQELAISHELEKALVLRRVILVGMKEPNVASNEEAQKDLEVSLKRLDQEIEQIRMEMDLQKFISTNTAIAIINNRVSEQQQVLDSNASDNGKLLGHLSELAGSDALDNSNQGGFSAKDTYIYLPIPESSGGLGHLNGKYSVGNNISNTSSNTNLSPSLQKFQSKDAYADGRATIYRTSDGKLVKREGGTLAWRNNNPGNIRMSDWAKANGAIGVGPSGFAIFPTPEIGKQAIVNLLKEGKYYRNNTIEGAISRYAPPSENNTAAYISFVTNKLGLPASTKMSSLTDNQRAVIVDAITKKEGWKEGTTTNIN
ncbi:integrating conjugative element protein [Ursidibacter maritimus]|uniref:Integrating conjugative element protein n=1 Tax=Ursidibacter maritimus TaxID=1331689 RepID=A0A949T3R0_9PAST|nr:integrating conjugative element protein [Ursidibacter maritimus]KAE9541365.1 conjugal transfer protein [Ursidibacter maritimus]MBV6524767.1 integrating conjugative element protein [Ursidibacter maritimus]MBV6526487.1 integrating conjugative element protein [Ursidibacter maritimus]MBV6527109.1 integrating conjugative element protein [Ursidibacter maritimus]MBV6529056.1 integrating conjugative element protein [Ursidibacter maritimus]